MKVRSELYWPTSYFQRLMHFLFRQKTICIGFDRIPREGGAVIVPKHQSNCDPPTFTRLFPRMIYFMGKTKLFKSWIGRIYFGHAGVIPVDQGNLRSVAQAMRVAAELVKAGNLVGIFAEGTRKPGLEVGDLYRGAVSLALKTQAPIFLVAILYSDNQNAAWWRRHQKTVIIVDEPIPVGVLKLMADPLMYMRIRLKEMLVVAEGYL